jgi:hypothetical protein
MSTGINLLERPNLMQTMGFRATDCHQHHGQGPAAIDTASRYETVLLSKPFHDAHRIQRLHVHFSRHTVSAVPTNQRKSWKTIQENRVASLVSMNFQRVATIRVKFALKGF